MKNTTRIVSAGLIPLLILGTVPGCSARHRPDWDKVQALPEGKQVEVQLYKDEGRSPRSGRPRMMTPKVRGHFLSASESSIAITEKSLKDGGSRSVYEEIQRNKIRKILAEREFSKRWPGWLALGIAFAVGAQSFRAEADFVASYQLMFGLAIPIGISIPFFLGSRMGGIYEVPPKDRERATENKDDTSKRVPSWTPDAEDGRSLVAPGRDQQVADKD